MPPFEPGTAILTKSYFLIDEEYFQSSHIVGEPAFTTETTDIETSIKSTLLLQSLNVQTVAMSVVQIVSGTVQTIEWRVDVTYLGVPITIDFFPIGSHLVNLGGVHQNSIWREHQGLTTVSHAPQR